MKKSFIPRFVLRTQATITSGTFRYDQGKLKSVQKVS